MATRIPVTTFSTGFKGAPGGAPGAYRRACRNRRVAQKCHGTSRGTQIANSVSQSHRAPLAAGGRAEVRALSLGASRPDERAPRRRARACHPWRASAATPRSCESGPATPEGHRLPERRAPQPRSRRSCAVELRSQSLPRRRAALATFTSSTGCGESAGTATDHCRRSPPSRPI